MDGPQPEMCKFLCVVFIVNYQRAENRFSRTRETPNECSYQVESLGAMNNAVPNQPASKMVGVGD